MIAAAVDAIREPLTVRFVTPLTAMPPPITLLVILVVVAFVVTVPVTLTPLIFTLVPLFTDMLAIVERSAVDQLAP